MEYVVGTHIAESPQTNLDNGIWSNTNVATDSSKKEDNMPYLKEGWVGQNKRADGRYKGGYMDNGKEKSVYGRTKAECAGRVIQAIKERDERLKNGDKVQYKNMTLHKWLDEWFVGYVPTVSPSQAGVVKNNIRHIKEQLRNAKLNDLNPFEIERGIAKIISSRTGLPSTKMQKECFDTLNMAYKEAKRKKLVKENVMEGVNKTQHKSVCRLAFPAKIEKAILEYAREHSEYYKYFLFGLNTGCRPDELSKIRKCHMNFGEMTVFIDGTKTEGSKRTMPMFAPLNELRQVVSNLGDNDKVFTATRDVLNDELRRILTRISVENPKIYSLYSMRHTVHTRLNEMGVDVKTIAKWLGNSPEIATRVYIKVMPEHEKALAERIDSRLGFDPKTDPKN